jgi:type II secretory pathway pseudopilin PulG
MKANLTNEQGFTLVEVIIGMTLMIIIMTGILSLFQVSISSHLFSMGRIGDIQQSRLAMNTIADEIRYAKSIVPPTSPFQTLQYTDSQDNLTILSFNPVDKKVYIKHGAAASKPITSGVFTNVQFKTALDKNGKIDPKLLMITIILKTGSTQKIMVHLLN